MRIPLQVSADLPFLLHVMGVSYLSRDLDELVNMQLDDILKVDKRDRFSRDHEEK